MAEIGIDIAANTRKFQAGVGDVERALSDVADSLDDLARDADKSGDKAERALDGVADEAKDTGDAVEKIERSFRDMADAAKRESDDAGDALGKNIKRGTDGAKEGLGEFKQEANSTARESAASFDGSADSIVDAFQEIAANAFGGFGPAGAVAGLAAAAGVGLVGAAFTQAGEDAEKLAEITESAYSAMLDAGTRYVTEELVADTIKEIIGDTERLKAATADANATGLDRALLVRAQAGDSSALAEAERQLADAIAAAEEKNRESIRTTGEADLVAVSQIETLRRLQGKLTDTGGAYAEAGDRVALAYDAMGGASESARDRTTRAADVSAQRLQAYADSVRGIPGSVSTRVDIDTGAAERALERFTSRRPKLYIEGTVVDRFGRQIT